MVDKGRIAAVVQMVQQAGESEILEILQRECGDDHQLRQAVEQALSTAGIWDATVALPADAIDESPSADQFAHTTDLSVKSADGLTSNKSTNDYVGLMLANDLGQAYQHSLSSFDAVY